MNNDNQFIDGLAIYKPHEKAPDFVKGNGMIYPERLLEWAKANNKLGGVRFQVLESKKGKYYAKVDDYEPKGEKAKEIDYPESSINPEDIPF